MPWYERTGFGLAFHGTFIVVYLVGFIGFFVSPRFGLIVMGVAGTTYVVASLLIAHFYRKALDARRGGTREGNA